LIYERYFADIDGVDGWLSKTTAYLSHHLMVHQSASGMVGNVCEIGVHHGKYFYALATGLASGEKAVAIDLFENQHENVDKSGAGDRSIFMMNAAKYFDPTNVVAITANSMKLTADTIAQHGKVRFFSIDGGHTEGLTENDLRLAEASICEGGIVALDDIMHYGFCGVMSGLAKYKYSGGKLKAFALVPNKLFLSDSQGAKHYRTYMKSQFPDFLAKADLEMMTDIVEFYHDRLDIVDPTALDATPEAELSRIKNSRRYKLATKLANAFNLMAGRV
jgi:hypothetical protein